MMKERLSLGEASLRYLATLSPQEREPSQQEVNRFVRWYGWEHPLDTLTAPEIGNYAERVSSQAVDPVKTLEPVRAFLTFAKKEGLTPTNLSVHLRVKKGSPRVSGSARPAPPVPVLSAEGREQLSQKLEALRQEQTQLQDQVRRAREDKDFRENAPLDAAREHLAHVTGRIREMETAIQGAGEKVVEGSRLGVGQRVTLRDLASGEVISYSLVDPWEVDLARGKISVASPIGKAVQGRREGEVVSVTSPAGVRSYSIEKVGG